MPARILLIVILFIFLGIESISQKIEFEHITNPESIHNATVNAILKDSYGFMWFGTYNGLMKYDGYSVKNFLYDPNDPDFGEKGDVRCFYESADSVFFIGTLFGICIYNRDNDSFIRFCHDKNNPNSISSNRILSIHGDKKGNIWVGTGNGLDKFEYKTGVFKHYHPFRKGDFVASITEDLHGNIWLYGGTEVCKFNPDKNTFDYMKTSNDQRLKDSHILSGQIFYDSRDNLWVGNMLEGMSKYDLKTGEVERFSKQNKRLKSDLAGRMLQDHDGFMWIGTDGGGLYKYDYLTKKLICFEYNPNEESSLSGNAIHSLYESEPGVLWIGMYAGGVDIIKKYKKKFIKFGSKGEPGKKLTQKSVLSFSNTKDGNIWIGTDGGGLNLFNPRNYTFKYLNEENGGTCANVIKSLCFDRDNNLWCGSYRKGLCKMDLSKGTVTNYRADIRGSVDAMLKDNIWSLCESYDGRIWMGLLAGGLDIYDKKTGIFVHNSFENMRPNQEPINILVLFEDSQKRMWIGTETAGAFYFDSKKNSYSKPLRDDGKMLNNIRDIFEDSKGNIWFAMKGGGLKRIVDLGTNKFETFTSANGLPTNDILAILEDNHQNLWLSTDKGISRFNIQENKFYNFDIEDGLQGKKFNNGAKLKAPNGFLYFGGPEGFNMFHPDSIHSNTIPPPVTITAFKIFNHLIQPNIPFNGRNYIAKSIEQTKELNLNYDDNIFSIEFAALSFIASTKNKYKYKLEGFNDDWIDTDAGNRTVTYTNLNPGTYTFKVIASNNDGIWNNAGTSIKIVILPPWWMTWWFKIVLISVLISAVFLIIYFRTRSIKIQNKLLEEEVKKQTAILKNMNSDLLEKNEEIMLKSKILEQNNMDIIGKTERILEQQERIVKQNIELEEFSKTKDKFYSIIAHDLKNPVHALTLLSKMLRKEFKDAKGAGSELINNLEISSERIKNLVLNLTEWTKSQTGKIQVNPVKISVKDLVEENIELHSMQTLQKQLQIHHSIDETLFVFADYNMADTIVRNILSNSIKYTPRGGEINIESFLENDEVVISFEDNGVGISQDKLENLFQGNDSVKGTDNETGTGLGLIISKEFTELNKGNIYAESKPGKGSTFYLCLPGGMEDIGVRKIKHSSILEALLEIDQMENAVEFDDEIIIKEEFRGKKILLVDDDDQVRNSIKSILSNIFEVYEAPDVKNAMILCEDKFPDLIISDIMMPGETGISFCHTIKSNRLTSHIPVILLTGQTSEETHLESLTAGADAYIVKPFDRKIFLITVNNLLTSLENMKLKFSFDTDVLPSDFTRNVLDEELLSRIIKFVEHNISDPELNGDMICKEIGTSKRVLYVKLKNIAGQTVNEFIRTIRLKKSIKPLLEGRLNITQISTEMGFNSASYFTRSFTKHFGLSPKEYIMKQKSFIQ